MDTAPPPAVASVAAIIGQDAEALSEQLQALRHRLFPPGAQKGLRSFSSGEAARLIGVTDGYLRQLALAGQGPQPEKNASGRRLYTLEEIGALRRLMAQSTPSYLPTRRDNEHLQVIAVTNFKGGSGKTTTAAHLAQFLALRGYRVLAIDLDPQASLSALFGYQPEFDIGPDETLYGALRYTGHRRPTAEVVRPTYFHQLDLVPGNIELQEFEFETSKAVGADDNVFFRRVAHAIAEVADRYDVVVIDCPPQLGYLTLSALCAATALLITVHPQMLDVASMNQFLAMTSDLLRVVQDAGGDVAYDFQRYLITRLEPQDGPQTQIVEWLRSLFGDRVLANAMVKSTAISDAGLSKQTMYEITRDQINRRTYERALEAMDAVNGEIVDLIEAAWGRAPR